MTDTQEEFKLSGSELLGKVKELIAAGNVRRIAIKTDGGSTLLEIPLNWGVAGAAAATLVAPILLAVGAIAAVLTKCSLVVTRKEGPPEPIDVTVVDAKDTPQS